MTPKSAPGLNFEPRYRKTLHKAKGFAQASRQRKGITLSHNFVKSCSFKLILMSFVSARQALSIEPLFFYLKILFLNNERLCIWMRTRVSFLGNSSDETPPPFSFLKVLKNGQSVLGYRTRRAVSNDTKIKSRS